MFLVRSAFWLTVAFIAIGPKDVDLGKAAGDLSARAVAAGAELVVSHTLSTDCASLECAGSMAILAAVRNGNPSSDSSMQDSSHNPVPFPRPRPDRMG